MQEYYTAKYDAVFKAIFCDENNRDILKWFLEHALNTEVEILEVQSPELLKHHFRVKGKTLDVLVDTSDGLKNIELNSSTNQELHRRNAAYIFTKYGDEVKIGDSYSDMNNLIQINLSCELPQNYPPMGKYRLTDIETELDFIDNLTIYEFNIDKIKNLCYNEHNKEYDFIAMLDSNKEELEKLCEGDAMMEKFSKDDGRLNNDKKFVEFMSAEKENQMLINTHIKHEKLDIAKKLLAKGVAENVICESMDLTMKDIESLKANNE